MMSTCVTRSTTSKQKDKDKANKENVDQDDVDKTADAAAAAAHQKELDDRQKKHNAISNAWARCNNAIFRGAGKMTATAYAKALANVSWEKKFVKKGKNTEVNNYTYISHIFNLCIYSFTSHEKM